MSVRSFCISLADDASEHADNDVHVNDFILFQKKAGDLLPNTLLFREEYILTRECQNERQSDREFATIIEDPLNLVFNSESH